MSETMRRPKDVSPEAWFWSGFDRSAGPDGCHPWTRGKPQGYGTINFRGRRYTTHRLAWILTHGALTTLEYVCHHCDNKACGNVAHLFVGDAAANARDLSEKGLANRENLRGMNSPCARLTDDQVREIRARGAAGESCRALGAAFGVNETTVSAILRRKTWQHIA